MPILIVFYSLTGNNRLLAQHLSQILSADLEEVTETSARGKVSILLDLLFGRRSRIEALTLDPAAFAHVVFVAPVWDRHIATPMRAAMRLCAPGLTRYSLMSLCGQSRPGQADTLRREAEAETGAPPLQVVELWIAELLSAGREASHGLAASNHRIEPCDLEYFAAKIDDFVQAIRQERES